MFVVIIYALIGIFVLYGFFIFFCLFRYRAKFKQAAEKLKEEPTQNQIREWLCGNSGAVHLFADKKLDKTLEEYAIAYQKNWNTEGTASFVDVTDYFNRDYLDEIGSEGISNIIPGVLTGLGILGTFIGLISGISGFDAASSEVMVGSIKSLLAGMRSAFGTSICGVVGSLLFSVLYKHCYVSANKQMENFVAAFHSAGLDGSEKTTESQMLHYQQQQTEQLQNLSAVISQSISDTMKNELAPIFLDMQQSMKDYISGVGQQQKESLDQIVREFVRQMNLSLKGQFDTLAETLNRTEECQRKALAQMQKVVDGIVSSYDQVELINKNSRQTVDELQRYIQLLEQYQQRMNEEIGQIQRQIETSCTLNQQQAKYIETLTASEERMGNLTGYIKQEANAVWEMAEKISDHCTDQLAQISRAAEANLGQMSQAVEGNLEHLSQATAAGLDQLSQTTATSMGQISRETAANLEQMFQATSTNLKRISHIAERKVADITELSGEATAQLNAAAGEMERAIKQLNKTVETTLTGISASFEQNLSDASQRLSNTTGKLSSVVEEMPEAISKAQAGYQDAMNRMSWQTREYVIAIQELTQKIQAAAQTPTLDPAQNNSPDEGQEKADKA